MTIHDDYANAIAIIGMSGRFPRAKHLRMFLDNLRRGVDCISFWSQAELRNSGISPGLAGHPKYVPARGSLDDIELFDAGFFRMSEREAALMDPQHRLFMECCWHALEEAGHDPACERCRIGVYGGAGISTYSLLHLFSNPQVRRTSNALEILIGNDKDFLATTVAYHLNLQGPAVTVQSACSTSLAAVHLAVQSLLNGECDMALAGAVSVQVPQASGYLYQEGGIVSSDGHCRPFDAAATGTVFGNGVGAVVLKRLVDAIEDRDHIHALVRGSALNNDGSRKIGFTAPSVEGQAAVIAEALGVASINPDTIGYIEAHGTATPLGDPIEFAALREVFGDLGGDSPYIAIGSVKANIGHMDAAAGIAGLIAAVLALEHGQLFPLANFERPNPKMDLSGTPFWFNRALTSWPDRGYPRRAGVSSFGLGGTNAHVVVEQALSIPRPEGEARVPYVFILSANSATTLNTLCTELVREQQRKAVDPGDLAFTLRAGRRSRGHRRAIVAAGIPELVDALQQRWEPGGETAEGEPWPVFLFPGQSTQYFKMGSSLYEAHSVFRDSIDECADRLAGSIGCNIRDSLYGRTSGLPDRVACLEPALFSVEYSLARLWMSWGVRPRMMAGYCLGELVAACVASVFSLEDALSVVALRSRLVEELEPGAMLAVGLPKQDILPFLKFTSLASVDGPARCVLSGPTWAVRDAKALMREAGLEHELLPVSRAYHSPMMDAVLARLADFMSQLKRKPPEIPFFSVLSGKLISTAEATDPGYWARQLRGTMQFGAVSAELGRLTGALVIECGPTGSFSDQTPAVIASLPGRGDDADESQAIASAAATLWNHGVEVDWHAFRGEDRSRRIAVPGHPLVPKRCWIDAPHSQMSISPASPDQSPIARVKQQLRLMSEQLSAL